MTRFRTLLVLAALAVAAFGAVSVAAQDEEVEPGTNSNPTPNRKGFKIESIAPIDPFKAPEKPPSPVIKMSDEDRLKAGTQFVFTSNGISIRVRVAKWNKPPVDGCKRDVIFVIDNSGSMTKFRHDIFAAVNVAAQTLRDKGNARVSTVVFSDDPYVHQKNANLQPPKGVTVSPRDAKKCVFCWQKSNLQHQPFPNPNSFGSGSLTDLGAAFTLVTDIIDKDTAGKGPLVDGPRIDPKRPYWVILLSDLLVTKGMSSPTSSEFRKLRNKVMKLFCTENWQSVINVERSTGKMSFKPGVKPSEACKGAVAQMHYFFFRERDPGYRDMTPMLEHLKDKEGKPSIADMDAAWRAGSLQYHKQHRSWTKKQLPMYHLLSGQALGGGGLYKARTTAMISLRGTGNKYRWETLDFVKELLGEECEPELFDRKDLRIDVQPMEFPKLQLSFEPVRRHFANNKDKIDPIYENSLGFDSPEFLTTSLEHYLEDVQKVINNVKEYTADLKEQLSELKLAAASPGSQIRASVVGKAKHLVDTEVRRAEQALATMMNTVVENMKFKDAYIGGFASIKGSDPVYNQKLSGRRTRGAFCQTLGVLNEITGKSALRVHVGYFGHKQHCQAVLDAIGTPDASCADAAAVQKALRDWIAASTTPDEKAARKKEALALEDEARKAEIHFSLLTAEGLGFSSKCCFALNGAKCSAGVSACSAMWGDDTCADTSVWRTNWETAPPTDRPGAPKVSGAEGYKSEVIRAKELVKSILDLAKPHTF